MLVIGIAGGTGSGKTTVVERMIENLPPDEVAVISQDAYYRDNSHLPMEERQKINFDHPRAIEFELLIDHLRQLKTFQPVQEPIYSYITCTRSPETKQINPTEVVIVEGILILTNPELRDLFDIKVYVYADADDRLIRVIRRDILERGRSVEAVLDRYLETVKPMHEQFIEPSKAYADIIIPEGGENKVAIDLLTNIVQQNLTSANNTGKVIKSL